MDDQEKGGAGPIGPIQSFLPVLICLDPLSETGHRMGLVVFFCLVLSSAITSFVKFS